MENIENKVDMQALIARLRMENEKLKKILDLSVDLLFWYDIENNRWIFDRVQESAIREEREKPLFDLSPEYARKMVVQEDLEKYDRLIECMRRGDEYPDGSFRMMEKGYCNNKRIKGLRVEVNGKTYIIGSVKSSSVIDTKKDSTAGLDPLTKVYNKSATAEYIETALANSTNGALLMIDIDNFKKINDTYGHLFGDEVLCDFTKAVKNLFRFDDIVGRVGGDEFVVYMKNVSDIEEIKAKATKVCKAVSGIYVGENTDISISASIGIATNPKDGKDFKTLFAKADTAMYYSKNSGKNSFTIYDENNSLVAVGGRNRRVEQAGAYTTFGREVDSEVNNFAYELTHFTYQIMEETTDMDSAINLLLRKVKSHYTLSDVSIYGVTSEVMTLECLYEVNESNTKENLGTVKSYTRSDWDEMMDKMSMGFVEKRVSKDKKGNTSSSLVVPMYADHNFVGYIEFVKDVNDYDFTESERNLFKAFARIISAYAISTKAYLETYKTVERMNDMDALTGLPKYEKFHEILQERSKEILENHAIMFVYSDISHFKMVNESYGYAVGDSILRYFAKFIRTEREECIECTRVYSDNFVAAAVVDREPDEEKYRQIVAEMNEELEQELKSKFFDSNIRINSGIYIMKSADENVETAITNANVARKEAKNSKSSSIVVFDEKMLEAVRKDIRLTSELPKAIEDKELCVYYQPKTECGSTNIIGAEALVRWKKPDGSMVFPDEFIPVFEKNGAIVEVDYYVYDSVFKYIADRIKDEQFIVPISVNVSRVHLETPGFIEYIKELFDKYNVPAKYIEFELTESIYIKDTAKVRAFNDELRELGSTVSMDDFGQGYSSLTMLNNLPIDVLKLDKSLMRNDTLTKSDEIIVGSIINMAKKLKMRVVCEGVETEAQSKFLSSVGCDVIQGYLYSKPLPEDAFTDYMENHKYAQADEIRFAFNDNLTDETGRYTARIIGRNVTFTDGPVLGMRALHFPGGMPGKEILEIPAAVYNSKSYSISMWVNEEEANLWTSAIYTRFENGFTSIMPRGWEMKGVFRIKADDTEIWHDAGGNDTVMPGWNHIVATLDAANCISQLYINGQKSALCDYTPDLYVARRVMIGGDVYQPSFVGKIADVRFYNATLTAADVEELYNSVVRRMK